jgi:hypothetical protein
MSGCTLVGAYLAVWLFAFVVWIYGAYFFFRARRFFQPRSWVIRWLSPIAKFQTTNFVACAAPYVIRARNAMLAFVGALAAGFIILQVAIGVGASCAP